MNHLTDREVFDTAAQVLADLASIPRPQLATIEAAMEFYDIPPGQDIQVLRIIFGQYSTSNIGPERKE